MTLRLKDKNNREVDARVRWRGHQRDRKQMEVTKLPKDFLADHLVRYEDLIPCTTAFIDTRTPGSKEKENFTIIGPGVAENPDQHVHITRAHGFNIGGARQPPRCVNSQHSHNTAEVFIVHSGTWQFTTGEHGTDGTVTLNPGDTISIPTQCFRGFENIGDDTGHLFAVLGGDDPGRVTWAPYVFEQAQQFGLVLLENGALVDTEAGEVVPQDIKPMPPTNREMVNALTRLDHTALEACVLRANNISRAPSDSFGAANVIESHILGSAKIHAKPAPLNWPHGFNLSHLQLAGMAHTGDYQQDQEEVLLVQYGQLEVRLSNQTVLLGPGDVFTMPLSAIRCLSNPANHPCEVFIVHGGDTPKRSFTV